MEGREGRDPRGAPSQAKAMAGRRWRQGQPKLVGSLNTAESIGSSVARGGTEVPSLGSRPTHTGQCKSDMAVVRTVLGTVFQFRLWLK